MALRREHPSRGPRRFDHHAPGAVSFDGGEALAFDGSLLGETSPVHAFTPPVGAEIRLKPGASLDPTVDPSLEHGVLVDTGTVTVEGVTSNARNWPAPAPVPLSCGCTTGKLRPSSSCSAVRRSPSRW